MLEREHHSGGRREVQREILLMPELILFCLLRPLATQAPSIACDEGIFR